MISTPRTTRSTRHGQIDAYAQSFSGLSNGEWMESSDALERDDRQMSSPLDVRDDESKRRDLGALRRSPCASASRALCSAVAQHLARRLAVEPLMRPMLFVPNDVGIDLALEKTQ